MMRWRAAALGALIMTVSTVHVRAESAGCQLVKAGELSVKFDHNRPLVPVSINGKAGWFLVDTGAASSSIWGGAAAAYGLSETTATGTIFYGVGGSQKAGLTVVREFALSDVKVKGLRLYVIGRGGSPAEAGLLGRDFLSHFDLEFDLANKMLRLWQPRHCGVQSLAYWTKDPGGVDLRQEESGAEYKVKVLVNGAPIDAILDSGATTSVVTPEAASAAGVKAADYSSERLQSSGIGERPVETRLATFDTLTVGTEQVKHAKLAITDMFRADTEMETGSILPHRVHMQGEPSMLLGADFLRAHRVLVSPQQHLLYFTYSGGPIYQVVGEAVAPAASRQAAPSAPAPAEAGK